MAALNLTQAQETNQPEPKSIVSPAAVMRELWNATNEGRNMSQAQLEWLASAGDVGGHMLRNLQTVLTGAGCLIVEDATKAGSAGSGALQSPQDVADLLFMTENLIDAAVGMIEIGSEANFKAHDKRWTSRLEKVGR